MQLPLFIQVLWALASFVTGLVSLGISSALLQWYSSEALKLEPTASSSAVQLPILLTFVANLCSTVCHWKWRKMGGTTEQPNVCGTSAGTCVTWKMRRRTFCITSLNHSITILIKTINVVFCTRARWTLVLRDYNIGWGFKILRKFWNSLINFSYYNAWNVWCLAVETGEWLFLTTVIMILSHLACGTSLALNESVLLFEDHHLGLFIDWFEWCGLRA